MEKKTSVMAWLFGAGLCMGFLPELALTVCMAGRTEPLPALADLGIRFAAFAAGYVCFMRAVYLRFGKEPEDTGKKLDWGAYVTGLFPCIFVYLILLYSGDRLLPVLAAVYGGKKGIFAAAAAALLMALLLFMGLGFFSCLNNCRRTPLRQSVRRFFSRAYLGLPMALCIWLAVLAAPVGLVLIRKIWEEPGNLIWQSTLLLGALATAALLNAALSLAERIMAGGETASERRRPVGSLAALLLCLILFFSQNMAQLTGNEASLLNARLKDSLIEYGFYLAAYDINSAAGIAGEAAGWMDEALREAEQAQQEAGDDPAALKKAEKKVKALQKVCGRYEIFRTDGQALAYVDQYKREGRASQNLVEEALALSEEYPGNLQAQYAAALIGSSLTYDGADHYDRTAKALLRLEEQYLEERAPGKEARLLFEKDIARMLMQIYHEEEAAEILEEIEEEAADTEVYELLARCYDHTGRQEEAYELAADCADRGLESPYLAYYAALSALKLGKTDESLAYASKLAAYMPELEGEELKECDVWMFELMEFLVMKDSSRYTEFQYPVYEDLTETQNAFVDGNPFFRNYLDAAYLAYGAKDKDDPTEGFARIDAVLEVNPELASAWYLRGVIASNTNEETYMREAVECYQRAGELNDQIPAVWYAMAREYDRLEEYENGIEACKRALALLPEQDHGSDWYGIQFHCSQLLKTLLREVGE